MESYKGKIISTTSTDSKTFKEETIVRCILKNTKPLVFILIICQLFQSCSVYKPTSLTLKELTEIDSKIRIKTKDDRIIRLKRIYMQDSVLIGVTNKKTIRIFEKDVNQFKVKDRKASNLVTILTSVIGTSIFAFLFYMGLGGQEI